MQNGALLLFDEVMTGFRVGWGGAQGLYDIKPDLTCLGKVIGGGLPVGAYGGPRKLMEMISPAGPVYQAGTLSGNPAGHGRRHRDAGDPPAGRHIRNAGEAQRTTRRPADQRRRRKTTCPWPSIASARC